MTDAHVGGGDLASHASATVFEAGDSCMALPATIKPVTPEWRVSGPAFPVHTAPGQNIWIHRAIYAAPAASVLVVSTDGEREFGYWGEVMSRAAAARGLAGLVLDGCVRDRADLLDVGFPVFATGLFVRGTGKDAARGGGLVEAVDIGGARVVAGDTIVADADGVVVVPRADVAAVAAAADRRVGREREIFAALARGETTLALYGWDDPGT